MSGILSRPDSTLADQTVALLAGGPLGVGPIVTQVMQLSNASGPVAQRLVTALLAGDPRVKQLADGRWTLVSTGVRSPLLEECTFAVVDVETTGLAPDEGARITEIAVVLVEGHRCEIVLESLINPGCPIPDSIVALTGITTSMVAGAPGFDQLADQVLGALSGRVFVAHNARFDWRFVSSELHRTRNLALDGPRFCTVKLARRLVQGQPGYSLGELANRFGLTFDSRHRAAGDAMVTARLLSLLLQRARERGIMTLGELDRLHRTPLRDL